MLIIITRDFFKFLQLPGSQGGKTCSPSVFSLMCMQPDRCALSLELKQGKVAHVSHKTFWHLLMDWCSEMVEMLLSEMCYLCVALRVRMSTKTDSRRELFSRSGYERLQIVSPSSSLITWVRLSISCYVNR